MYEAVSSGAAPFSIVDDETGEKRQAYADDLTDAQLEFVMLAKEEREKMKKESADREMQKQQMKQNF